MINSTSKQLKNPYLNLVAQVWYYGKECRSSIIVYYIAFILAQTIHDIGPYAFGKSIDILQHFSRDKLNDLLFWQAISVATMLFFWLFHGPARVLERTVALKIVQNLKLSLYEGLTKMPLKWHLDHHSGDTISREKKATVALNKFASDQFLYIETIVKFIVAIGFLTWVAPLVGVLSLISCFLAMSVVFYYDKILIPLYHQQNEIDNKASSTLFDYLSNITTIKMLRLGALTKNNLSVKLLSIWPFFKKDAVVNEVKWFWMNTILVVVQTIILITYIAYEIYDDAHVPIGTIVIIFRYQWELSDVFYTLSAHYSDLVKMNSDLLGLTPILNALREHQSKILLLENLPSHQNLEINKNWQEITIKNLTFSHNTHQIMGSFKDFNFTFKRGEKIALIGSSGAGKSTLLRILSTALEPQSGSLVVDEKHFSTLLALGSIITLIPQSPEIFQNTIEFNLTLGLEKSQEELASIIKLACFDSVLINLPNGLQTDMREKGLNLSVGQSQRLALARGLLAAQESSVILLDEPTSSVDQNTEETIITQILEYFPDKTIIATVHRLHILSKFDRVVTVGTKMKES